ncbi:PREDICTED: uncharacterized protein LOC108558440 [Nicrophorus vespilloides]|uniref:Uncharacterized protein LOC108558440 n=1 Tax=Nicrophorus vespilloides TaxID=110193 RepID=A0ABM1M8E3_NICVS|nr:PREDICTED: uncharacterized protein LOC108558440 [Nicrophorus vespilloides]
MFDKNHSRSSSRMDVFFGILLILATTTCEVLDSKNATETVPSVNQILCAPTNEFPKDNSSHNIRINQTILEHLAHHPQNFSEVGDLLHGCILPSPINNATVTDEPVKKSDEPKSQVELIQEGNNEDSRIDVSPPSHGRTPLVQGQLAAILAGVFVIIAVIGYVGLLSWRRFLENRYGNREMLVNEEEFYDPNDMRHFSI